MTAIQQGAVEGVMKKRETILIVDDVDINRIMLAEIFRDSYEIVEAANGQEAITSLETRKDIVAVLLDLLMPDVNGLEVLKAMNQSGKIKSIPVFLITAAESQEMLLEGYDLGAVDVIMKPFATQFLKCRISSVLELYEYRNDLEKKVRRQAKKLNELMTSITEMLATAIEFRDCESGEHVRRICVLTRELMNEVITLYPEYSLPEAEIEKIVTAAMLHDVGKIAIPDSILNKPGRLTPEEFEIMKQHTVRGCELLSSIPNIMDEGIFRYGYDICRHHHERWDGKGYPDGLEGDEVSIWAQVVAVADVYDALISPRVYKKAFSHDTAVNMIFEGQCGTFNPKVLDAFKKIMDGWDKADKE